MNDKVYISELHSVSDSKLLARCSVCNKPMECKIEDLNSVKMHYDAGCLYCDECFTRLYKVRHNQKMYREPF